jgi:hypothetical protein
MVTCAALHIHNIVTGKSKKKVPAYAHQIEFDDVDIEPCQLHVVCPMDFAYCIGCETVQKLNSEHFRVNCIPYRGWCMLAERFKKAQTLGYIDPNIGFQVNVDTSIYLVQQGVTPERVLKQGDNWFPDEVLYDFNMEGSYVSTGIVPLTVILAMPQNIAGPPQPALLDYSALAHIRDPPLDQGRNWTLGHAASDERKRKADARALNKQFREINNWVNELFHDRTALWAVYSKFKNMNGRIAQLHLSNNPQDQALATAMQALLHHFFHDVTPTGTLGAGLGNGPGQVAPITAMAEQDQQKIAQNEVGLVPLDGNVDSVESKGNWAIHDVSQLILENLPPHERRL